MRGLLPRLSVVLAVFSTICLGGCGGSSGNASGTSGSVTTSAVSVTSAASATPTPTATPTTTATPRTVAFDPPVLQLDNPTGTSKEANKSQELSLKLTALDASGNALKPSDANPMHVDVYGAPAGVITPVHQLCTTSTATFHYTGDDFPNNITVNCWIADKDGAAIGVTQMLKKNPHPHTGTVKHDIYLTQSLPDALKIKAAVGYDAASADGALRDFTIDTGSLGVLVPFSELPKSGGNVIGPGPEGTKFYSSSGNTYYGHFYLAPVSFKRTDGKIIQTIPIIVLAIESTACTGDESLPCHKRTDPPSPDLHYLGIGFNRNSTDPKDLFNSPTANAFLHITDADNGVNISPGYYLTPNDGSAKSGLSLGITNTDSYNVVKLKSNPDVPGDFLPQQGVYKFPKAPAPNEFTGTALLDVGIDSMFLDAPKDRWPDGTHDSNDKVPVGTDMEVSMGAEGASPAMQYKYTLKSPPDSTSPAPVDAKWINTAKTKSIFINTGRRPLFNFDYFYDGQDGRVGFLKLGN